ncbi:MAG: hypothetical protein BWY32_03544 [bacterium ADurb.Bin243]|nr:MAG: hypothetical protein BWY32_03544 [bacterium ADurb.Bin243]
MLIAVKVDYIFHARYGFSIFETKIVPGDLECLIVHLIGFFELPALCIHGSYVAEYEGHIGMFRAQAFYI